MPTKNKKTTKDKKANPYPIHTNHDSYFAQSLSDLTVARDFLEQHLPQPLIQAIDLSTLTLCKDRFVDEELDSRYTDMVYQLQFKNHTQCAYITIHIEHQSTPQADMPVRALQYECGIIKRHWDSHKTIPLVYSIVYYNGQKPWNYPTDLRAMMDAPAELIARYAFQPFQLVELNSIPDEVLREHLWSGVVGLAMKHAFDRDVLPILKTMINLLQQAEEQGKPELCEKTISYLMKTAEVSDQKKFYSLINSNLSQETGEKIMSLAQKLHEEGLHQGLEQGLHQGLEQGLHQGLEQGLHQGLEQGLQKGRQEGLQEGIEKGIQKGVEEGRLLVAGSMLKQGFSPEVIAQATGLPIEIIYHLKKTGKIHQPA
jgi:predicted transposase/invertase (TIGR01784 family)